MQQEKRLTPGKNFITDTPLHETKNLCRQRDVMTPPNNRSAVHAKAATHKNVLRKLSHNLLAPTWISSVVSIK